ncbi:transporter substrate-binding domain-containing protein [Bradyrhizobium sp. CCGUVB23]|uniref:transporter substrate-binding domain-containing protein n=1 Tax=Bradyrhizobium sp. CCGUVB23 TaxID=2949630 RepID=UPI0020B1912A|nr:transporter substrate-binding domain-containing protein [Bradyrhizobium sp. CCGUVB23]MCP3461049.1 transporter substrate-binding domain-containing protein [Bradyrhizobium sp. CCGUVB23]
MTRNKVIATTLIALAAAGTVEAQDRKWTEVRIVTEGGFLPWNYTKPDGTLAGFEIELANDLCRRMQVKCTITAQSFDSLIPALNAGKFDAIIDDVAITAKREEVIAFSRPYASLCYTFATSSDSDLASKLQADDRIIPLANEAAVASALEPLKTAFKDKTLGTLSAGTSVAFVEAYLKGVAQTRQYKTPEARDLDLVSGRVDVIVGSKDALLAASAQQGKDSMKIVGPCFQGGVVGKGAGIGLRKQDADLKAMFDKAIAEALEDGTIKKLSMPIFGMDVTPQ